MATKKIWGAGGTIPQSDWAQTDPTQMDYIHNKPENVASTEYVDNKLAEMLDSAPETLDTLNELAAALGDDPNFAATVAEEIGKKSTVTESGNPVQTFDADSKVSVIPNTQNRDAVYAVSNGVGVKGTKLIHVQNGGGGATADGLIPRYFNSNGQVVLNVGTPQSDLHATNKKYVDDALAGKMSIPANAPTYGIIPSVANKGTVGYYYVDQSLGNGPATVGTSSVFPTYKTKTASYAAGYEQRVILTGTPTQNLHAANKAYVDAAVTALGAPITSELTETTIALIFACNTEYHCVNPIESLSIEGFEAGVAGISEQWSIIFTAASTISVAHPSTIKWAVAEPIFEANKTYWLSFIPFGTYYLGVWTVMA